LACCGHSCVGLFIAIGRGSMSLMYDSYLLELSNYSEWMYYFKCGPWGCGKFRGIKNGDELIDREEEKRGEYTLIVPMIFAKIIFF
jgi:hypothetical protein